MRKGSLLAVPVVRPKAQRLAWMVLFLIILARPVWSAGPLPETARTPQPVGRSSRLAQSLSAVDWRVMSPVDPERLKRQDDQQRSLDVPPRFAVRLPVDFTPESSGTWEQLDADTWLWRLRISSPGALSLNLGFTRYAMPEGGRLFVYPAAADGLAVGPFTEADNEAHGQLWTPIVYSDDIVVEATVPAGERGAIELRLTAVNHDYRGFGRFDGPATGKPGGGARAVQKSGSCNVDVVCPQGEPWADPIRSVAMLTLNGIRICTGFLVNNTAKDYRPFLMTANHCNVTAANSASLVAYWNFQNSTCRPVGSVQSGQPGNGSLSQFNSGAIFRASYATSDFTLVELDDAVDPSFNTFWAGWDRSTGQFSSPIGIHHPSTDEKRITFSSSSTQSAGWPPSVPGNGTHIRAIWSLGVTEGGSSGSPLFSQAKRVIGQLHGGPSACGASDRSDYYGRFSVSWNGGGTASSRLRDWLDPLNTGVVTLDGIGASNPFSYFKARNQYLACWGIAGEVSTNCRDITDPNDKQMCLGMSDLIQFPCTSMTDRNLQLACYGMSVAPNYPSNCYDITDPGLQDFCYSVSSWGSWASCANVRVPADKALCQALTYRDPSYCSGITNANDYWFCYGTASHTNTYCGNIVQ